MTDNINLDPIKRKMKLENLALSPTERMKKFRRLQENAFKFMSEEGYQRYFSRNMKQRAIPSKI